MVQVKTFSGEPATFSDESLEELRGTFHGPLIDPGNGEYEEARIVQNGMFDRRPGLILRPSGIGDVIDAVNLARERDLVVAVRGGGHSIAGHGVCDDGLVLDLSAMRGVWVDPDERRVRVQGGATWGDVDRETQVFGLAVPGGVVSTTGVAGLTLGGGIGWLHRKYGLACDNLRAVEIVTADGQLRRASASENPELFWGLRGGGGNFGVVTGFEFDAHPVGPIVMNAACMYPAEDAPEVFRAWRDWSTTVPDEVTTRTVSWWMPEDPQLPPEVHDRHVLIVAAVYSGDPDEGEKVLQPVRGFGTPLADLSDKMPYRIVQSLFDPFFPKGELISYWKSIYLRDLPDDALDIVLKHSETRPDPQILVHTPLLGGAMGRVGPEETAFGDRGPEYMLSVDANWTDPADNERNIAWTREVIDEVGGHPSASGLYLNFSGDEELDAEGRDAAYGRNLERLREIKKEYDPNNLFRLNNNIPPAP